MAGGSGPPVCPEGLASGIPARADSAPAGARFVEQLRGKDAGERERAVEAELLSGNLPDFLRRLKPVTLSARQPGGGSLTATVCVMPDYLAVGSDSDFLRMPMDRHTATAVASRYGFVLPTRKIVDAVYRQADARLSPSPMTPGPEMSSTAYYVAHDARIAAQQAGLGVAPGALIAGHKKDVVVTRLLARNPGRIAIYGWHRPDGRPIQPLSTVHGAGYADYSHGIRLVSEVVYVDGEARSLRAALQDPDLAPVLSDEGPVPGIAALIPPSPAAVADLRAVRARLAERDREPLRRPAAVDVHVDPGTASVDAVGAPG